MLLWQFGMGLYSSNYSQYPIPARNIQEGYILTNPEALNWNIYYLMIDGEAGAICNYSINPPSIEITASLLNACIPSNAQGNYSTQSISSWTIDPPTAGIILGSPMAQEINVQWVVPSKAKVCAENPIFSGDTSCVSITIGEDIQIIEEVVLCIGDTIECGGQFYNSSGIFTPCYESWLGCDSCITCIIDLIPPVVENLGEVTVCLDECFEIGDSKFCEPGQNVGVLETWQGCDSTIIFDLNILDFKVAIAPHDDIICPNPSVNLDGTLSVLPLNPTIYWTNYETGDTLGNELTLEVFDAGIYCLSIEDITDGGTCIECTEVLKPEITKPEIDAEDLHYFCQADFTFLSFCVLPDSSNYNYEWESIPPLVITDLSDGCIGLDGTSFSNAQLCVTALNACGEESEPDCITLQGVPMTTVDITGGGFICESGSYAHSVTVFAGSDFPPFEICYAIDGVSQPPISANSNLVDIPVTQPGVYTVTSMVDGIGCLGISTGNSAEILSLPSPIIENAITENIDSSHYQLAFSISGGDTTQYEIHGFPNSGILNGNDFSSDPILCFDDYEVYVKDVYGCVSDTLFGTAPDDCICDLQIFNLTINCGCEVPMPALEYIVSFDLEGGQAPFQVIEGEGTIMGNTFTSDLLVNGAGYYIVIEDAAGCIVTSATSGLICDPSDPVLGSFNEELITTCSDLPVNVAYDITFQHLESCHVMQFVLHDALPLWSGDTLATNDEPIFEFLPGMELEQTYFISAVGSFDDGSGIVNFNDPFFNVSWTSTPVVFSNSDLEIVGVSPPTTICEGEFTQLYVEAIGAVAFEWSPALGLDNPNIQNPIAAPSASINYTVRAVDSLGCEVSANTQVYINCLTVYDTIKTGNFGLHNLNFIPFTLASPDDVCIDEDDGHVAFQLPQFGNVLTYYGISKGTDSLCLILENPAIPGQQETFRIYVTVEQQSIFDFQNNGTSDKMIIQEGEWNGSSNGQLLVYPNPAKDLLHIATDFTHIEQLTLFNISGKMILDQKPNSQFIELNIGRLLPGSYFLKVKTEKGIFVEKVFVLR